LISQAATTKRDARNAATGAAPRLARQETPALEGSASTGVPSGGETYGLDPLTDPRWQELVESHPHASVFHSTNWLKALKTVYDYAPVVVTTCAPGAPLTNGIAFCRIRSRLTGNRLVSLPFSDHCEPLFDHAEDLDTMLLRLRQRVNEKRWKYVEIRPLSHEPGGRAGFSQMISYYFHSLDLRPRSEQLFRNFHKDCVQRKIRRAEREHLEYEAGASDALLEKFYHLLLMTRRRHGLPPQPLAWFRGLVANFGDDIRIHVASKNGNAIASILTLTHKKSVVYKYGCSNVAFNNLGGTAFLFWQAIQQAKQQGYEEFELGRSDTGNTGLIAFKERWGASEKLISYWTYPRSHSPETTGWRMKLAQRLVPVIPDFALEAVGKLFYRHIG
jgi:CelD/BcsL family acetyltransferase involved in cellulose biosynthesis